MKTRSLNPPRRAAIPKAISLALAFGFSFSFSSCSSSFKGQVPEGNLSVVVRLDPYSQNSDDAKKEKESLLYTLSQYRTWIQSIDGDSPAPPQQLYSGVIVTIAKTSVDQGYSSPNAGAGDVVSNPSYHHIPGSPDAAYGYQVISPFHQGHDIRFDNRADLMHFLRLDSTNSGK